jgi:hypothetical protein
MTRIRAALPLLLLAGCSDNTSQTPSDLGTGEQGVLYECKDPGLTCNPHNACAINPVCGQDHLCHPERFLNCDDGLDCTTDSCGLSGQCINTPKEGFCALLVKDPKGGPSEMACLAAGTVSQSDPCKVCDPKQSTSKWSGREGGACDDGELCTKGDYCQGGECKGTYYGNQCSDGLECTDDLCDGKGGCSNAMKKTYCKIAGKCVKDKEADPTGCKICDVSVDPTQWTTLPDTCKIGGFCFKAGSLDGFGCGVCDPKLSGTGWSAAPGTCFIEGSCKKSGDKDASGCGVCDPTRSSKAWSPVTGKCLIGTSCVGDTEKSPTGCGVCDVQKSSTSWAPVGGATAKTTSFDGAAGGYTLTAPVGGVGWRLATKRQKAGSGSLYYGDAGGVSYDSGGASSGSATAPALAIPTGAKAAVFFWLYLDVESSPSHDLLSLKVGSTTIWSKAKVPGYKSWVPVEVSLSSFAGQSIQLSFVFDSVDGWGNTGEGVYLDEITTVVGCP